jgi:hypothetical protein
MTVGRVRGNEPFSSRWKLKTAEVSAVLVGLSAALGLLAFLGAASNAVAASFDLRFDGLAFTHMGPAMISTAIVLVVTAFFSGGWAYSALRERDRRSLDGPTLPRYQATDRN